MKEGNFLLFLVLSCSKRTANPGIETAAQRNAGVRWVLSPRRREKGPGLDRSYVTGTSARVGSAYPTPCQGHTELLGRCQDAWLTLVAQVRHAGRPIVGVSVKIRPQLAFLDPVSRCHLCINVGATL